MDEIEFSANNARALAELIGKRNGDFIAMRVKVVQIENVSALRVTLVCDSQRDGEYENRYFAIGGQVVPA